MNDLILYLNDEEELVLEQDAIGDMVLELTTPIAEHYDYYTGDYEVTPRLNDPTVLGTQYKVLLDDVTVHPIPVVTTTNPYGGKTVVIG